MSFNNIPQDIKALPRWVCWKLAERDGKLTKIPINPQNGKNAMSNNPDTWSDYWTAYDSMTTEGYNGIGFMFNGDGILGVDIDHCIDSETGNMSELARDIINTLDSYTEISQSGTGVHIICRGQLPEGKRRKEPVEMYEIGRYFAMTGKILDDAHTEVEERTAELAAVHKKYVNTNNQPQSEQKPAQYVQKYPEYISDDQLIKKACNAKDGSRFQALFNGDTSSYDGDDSRADFNLCKALAFWTCKDPERMDRIFRESGLFRPKWDRKTGNITYGQKTINEAIKQCKETYAPKYKVEINQTPYKKIEEEIPAVNSSCDINPEPFNIENLDKKTILDQTVFNNLFNIVDPMHHTKLLVELREKARSLGVARDFDTLYKAYHSAFIQRNKQAGSNIVQFTDCPLAGLRCGKWECTDMGVSKEIVGPGMIPEIIIACSHPILPVERLVNLDTGTEKIKLAFKKDGRWWDITIDRSQAANKSNIVQLADRGIEVTSENSKDLVKYIADIVNLNTKSIPVHKSISRLGWIEDEFAPYVPGIKYDGDIAYLSMYDSIKECGDFEAWKSLCVTLRKRIIAHIILAASFASVLIEPLGILPFIVHIWGGTGAGKTVGLMLGMSVWGDPDLGKLVRSLNSTQVALGRTASFLHSIPFAGDELQIIKSRWVDNYDQLIMFLTEGVDRSRGKAYGGVEDLKQWKCCFLFSGEEPITKSGSGGGAKNRVIEIECTDMVVEDGNHVSNFVRKNYGFAGKVFIENLPEENELHERYRALFKSVIEECDTTDKQGMAMAAILLADQLASEFIFMDEPLTIKDIKGFLQTKDDVDQATRAYEWAVNWIARNSKRFTNVENTGEIWGKLNLEESFCMVSRDVLDEQLKRVGFDYFAVIRKWAERGQVERNSQGKFIHQTHVFGMRGNYVKIILNSNLIIDGNDE